MKRVLVLFMVLVLAVLCVGCGEDEKDSESAAKTKSGTKDLSESDNDVDFTHVDIEWTNTSLIFQDSEGYELEVEYKISPWILLSNTDAINSAWDEVGQDYELPDYNEVADYFSGKQLTDFYYCVGSLKIKNTTSGWSIDETNSRDLTVGLGIKRTYNDYGYSSYESNIPTKGQYFVDNDSAYDVVEYVNARIKMDSDETDDIPFVLIAPENFTPNNPKGEYKSLLEKKPITLFSGQLEDYNYNNSSKHKNINIGIIGKGKKK